MGDSIREKLTFVLWLLGIAALLGVVCTDSKGLSGGEWIAQYRWVNLTSLCSLLAAIVTLFLSPQRIRLYFLKEDWVVLLLLVWLFANSDLHGERAFLSERFLFILQCGMLWFVLRIGVAAFPLLARCIPWLVVLTGTFEAIVGYFQIYGLSLSNHGLFTLTGTFFNPGPYSGYLAVSFVVGVGLYATVKLRGVRYALCGMLFLIGCLLPAGMSRSAWVATLVGCGCVWIMQRPDFLRFFRGWGQRFPKRRLVAGTVGLLMVVVLGGGLFFLKKDSAGGRLFMWKITARMIAERPLTGYGLNGFPAAYGEAQEVYFADTASKEWEKRVAGTPEYAFNEYLQLAAEGGIPLLLLALFFVGLLLYRGLRERNKASVAGIIAFGTFAFSSYPLQLPMMTILLLMLLMSCQATVTTKRFSVEIPPRLSLFTSIFCILLSLFVTVFLYSSQKKTLEACYQWERVRFFYTSKAYTVAMCEYAPLYEFLKNRPEYLFEYAMCARHTEDYTRSNTLFEQALKVSGDPMILNLLGRNYEDLAKQNSTRSRDLFRKSEYYFQKSVHRLPGRLYPYYLLAKLYSNPQFYYPEKAQEMAHLVLTLKEKVTSSAVREMRSEMRKLLFLSR